MRTHKMTTRSLSTAQEQEPHARIAKPQPLNQRFRKKFRQFSRFPSEIRLMVWEEFLNDYEDNPPVAWTLIWGMDDPDNYPDPTNIRLRPYIFIEKHCQNDRLVEYNSNPLLKVNLETRTAALRDQRYISIRVWDLDINIVVRPAMDYFYVDTFACNDKFRDVLPEFAAKYGNPTTFTLAEDMSFVKHAFALGFDWDPLDENRRHFDIAKNAPAAPCTWCALDKLFNNCLGTATTVVSHFMNEDTHGGFIDWDGLLCFSSGLFSGSRLWPAWAYYSRYHQHMMLMDDEDHTHLPPSFEFFSYLSVDVWGKICDKLMRYPIEEYDLQYSGDWFHIGDPILGPRDLGEDSHLDPEVIYDYVCQSFDLAQTRRVKPRRRVRILEHGRTLPEISGFSLRHQQASEAVELQTTCGTRCEHGIHKYPKKDGKARSGGDGLEAGDGNESSDAWLNWTFTWENTSDENDDAEDDDHAESSENSDNDSAEPVNESNTSGQLSH